MNDLICAAATVELISLRARLKRAQGYLLNSNMQLECELLHAQIDALEQTIIQCGGELPTFTKEPKK